MSNLMAEESEAEETWAYGVSNMTRSLAIRDKLDGRTYFLKVESSMT